MYSWQVVSLQEKTCRGSSPKHVLPLTASPKNRLAKSALVFNGVSLLGSSSKEQWDFLSKGWPGAVTGFTGFPAGRLARPHLRAVWAVHRRLRGGPREASACLVGCLAGGWLGGWLAGWVGEWLGGWVGGWLGGWVGGLVDLEGGPFV